MAANGRTEYIKFVGILLVPFLALTGCQGETNYKTTNDPVYELISINSAKFIESRGIEIDYSNANGREKSICLRDDVIEKESSALGIVEVKNALGTKAQLMTQGLRLATQGSVELSQGESLNLSIKQWKVPFWYPRWMPKQNVRLSIAAKFCLDNEGGGDGEFITLSSPWTKVE